jgi:hypothetical protein
MPINFRIYFYEALKAKKRESEVHDSNSFVQCLKLNQNASLFVPVNYLVQKRTTAMHYFSKVLDPTQNGFGLMYDVNYATGGLIRCHKTINLLFTDPNSRRGGFKHRSTANTGQFTPRHWLTNELNETVGKSDQGPTSYKSSPEKYQNAEIANLLQQISKFPQEESNYISIDLHTQKDDW